MSLNNSNVVGSSEQMILRFNNQGELQLWQFASDGTLQVNSLSQSLQQNRLTLEQIKKLGVAWVPTQLVVFSQLQLPAKRPNEIRAALPFALEESLSAPPEEYHFVIADKKPVEQGTDLQVMAVAKSVMQQWSDELHHYDLHDFELLADCFSLPFAKDDSIESPIYRSCESLDSDLVIVRTGCCQGFAVPYQLQDSFSLDREAQISLSAQECHWSFNAVQGWEKLQLKSLNLLNGEFAYTEHNQQWKLWLWPNIAAVILLAVMLSSLWIETDKARQDAMIYQAKTEQLFKQMFPGVKRIVSIKAQTLNRLKSVNTQNQNGDLMPLVYRLEPIIAKQKAVQINSLSWVAGSKSALKLKLSAKQSSDLQQLQKMLLQQVPELQAQLSIKNVTPEVAQGELNVVAN